jgi:hypothetical protein
LGKANSFIFVKGTISMLSSNIFSPDSVIIEYSLDGKTFMKPKVIVSKGKQTKRENLKFTLSKTLARYIRFTVFSNAEKNKEHWFLCDEIIIK